MVIFTVPSVPSGHITFRETAHTSRHKHKSIFVWALLAKGASHVQHWNRRQED